MRANSLRPRCDLILTKSYWLIKFACEGVAKSRTRTSLAAFATLCWVTRLCRILLVRLKDEGIFLNFGSDADPVRTAVSGGIGFAGATSLIQLFIGKSDLFFSVSSALNRSTCSASNAPCVLCTFRGIPCLLACIWIAEWSGSSQFSPRAPRCMPFVAESEERQGFSVIWIGKTAVFVESLECLNHSSQFSYGFVCKLWETTHKCGLPVVSNSDYDRSNENRILLLILGQAFLHDLNPVRASVKAVNRAELMDRGSCKRRSFHGLLYWDLPKCFQHWSLFQFFNF